MIEELIASGLSSRVVVVIISALPVVELRGALPIAINLFDIPWYQALGLSVMGNILPVPFLLLALESLAKLVSRVDIGRRSVEWVFQHTRKHAGTVEKYEHVGLVLFVAIPFPGTGAWTGSIAAFLCGLKFKAAFLSIVFGVIICGAIITCFSLLGWAGAVIAGVGLSSLAVLRIWKAWT